MEFFDLDEPLFEFPSASGMSNWTYRNAVEGVQVFGGIGAGKTSSISTLKKKLMRKGLGGLVLTVKPSEKLEWIAACRETGREQDLILFEPGGKYHFNFLQYEASQGKSSYTENIVDVLKTVIEAGSEKDSGRQDDPFWQNALDMLIHNVIDLCRLAYGKLSLQEMYDIVQTIPKAEEGLKGKDSEEVKAFESAFGLARANVNSKIESWFGGLSPLEQARLQKGDEFEHAILESVPEARLLKFLDQFFFESYSNLSEKTRSIIDYTYSAFTLRLLRDPVYSMFCRYTSNFSPEDCIQGKIIIVCLPVKIYHKVGRDCQILFKYIWQRAMEKREVSSHTKPVFLWADESQHFLHSLDADFQATARSSRVITVYLSQNLPNYYANMGGQRNEYKVKGFLGTLATKIFHANADVETNRYASELIGEAYFRDKSESRTVSESISQTSSVSMKLERIVRPEEFVSLRTGGKLNNFKCDAYLHKQGNPFSNGRNHIRVTFDQNYTVQ